MSLLLGLAGCGGSSSTPSTSSSSVTRRAGAASTAHPASATSTVNTAAVQAATHARAQLTQSLTTIHQEWGGKFSCAVHNKHTGSQFTFNPSWRNDTLSTVKLAIAAAVLWQCQQTGTELDSDLRAEMYAMISASNNDAADDLMTWVGVDVVRKVAGYYGLKQTTIQGGTAAGANGWWGYSTTLCTDLLLFANGIMWGTTVLTIPHRNYLQTLMTDVIPSEQWGVCVPPLPGGNTWMTKNGWGPIGSEYVLNSVGHIVGNGRDYTAVILSRSPDGFDDGQDRVNDISQKIYNALGAASF